MSRDELKPPHFENEKEEADWWDSHSEDVEAAFRRAAANGTLGKGTNLKKAKQIKEKDEEKQP